MGTSTALSIDACKGKKKFLRSTFERVILLNSVILSCGGYTNISYVKKIIQDIIK